MTTLVAVWPGMGHVALTAGYYLMSKLRMREAESLRTPDLFDVDHVDVHEGLLRLGRRPRNRLFLWKDPAGRRDLAVFIGEAQPPTRSLEFCGRLLDHTARLGVKRVFAFAALATEMHPRAISRVVGVANSPEGLPELRDRGVDLLPDGRIKGLNGVFLGAAAERNLPGVGLLGEMPGYATSVPFPKASKAVLETFATLEGLDLDLRELDEYGRSIEDQLVEALQKVQRAAAARGEPAEEEPEEEDTEAEGPEEPEEATPGDRRRIEAMFEEARRDRGKAFELKRELDQRGLFAEYEDRFLDLFGGGTDP